MTPPLINPDDTVILTNQSPEELRLGWNGRIYKIGPGASATVPFGLVAKDFGDPRSGPTKRSYVDDQGRRGQIPARGEELHRLIGLWGFESYVEKLNINALREQKPLPEDPALAEVVPKVTVTTSLGEVVKTPVDDPKGDDMVLVATNLDSPSSVAAEVARISQQLEKMKEIQDALANKPNPDSSQEVAEDGPVIDPPSS
jgi:hypothetical protein